MRVSIRGSAVALASVLLLCACDDKHTVNLVSTLSPTLISITPPVGTPDSIVAVTLTGTGFLAGGTTVTVGAGTVTVRDVRVNTSTLLTASFVIDSSAGPGDQQVTVTTSAGTSNPLIFTVVAVPRFVDLGSVIRDTRTDLMWEKKTPAGTGGLHDVSTTYTWCEATGNTDAGSVCAGNMTSWIGQVNAATFAGFSDWRVPSQQELQSLLLNPCPGLGALCIDPIFGPTSTTTATTTVAPYWSATIMGTQSAMIVDFVDGSVISKDKIVPNLVRAVRSAR